MNVNAGVPGMNLRWDFFVNAYDTHRYLPAAGLDGRENRHIAYVREFAGVVSVLQDKTNAVIESYKEVNRIVEELATCSYTSEAFTEHLDKIQQAVGPSLWSLVRYLIAPIDRSLQPRGLCQPRKLGR